MLQSNRSTHPAHVRALHHAVARGDYVVDPQVVAAALLSQADLQLMPWIVPAIRTCARSRQAA